MSRGEPSRIIFERGSRVAIFLSMRHTIAWQSIDPLLDLVHASQPTDNRSTLFSCRRAASGSASYAAAAPGNAKGANWKALLGNDAEWRRPGRAGLTFVFYAAVLSFRLLIISIDEDDASRQEFMGIYRSSQE